MLGNIPLIRKGFEGLQELKQCLQLNYQTDICFVERDKIRQYLKQQDLAMLLGIGNRFACIFHEGKNPTSGVIYQFEDKHFYKCHSQCKKQYDIVEVIEKLTELPNYKAFDYLKELYGIAEVKTKWQQEMEKQIDINLDVIDQLTYDVELIKKYPPFTRLLKTKGTIQLFQQIHYT